ncbi:MAG TPA: alanine--tRNA ligase [Verrucomicrobiae bacterium]|jgi:alanine--tRNA ligase|nr:alanine--tRNA ligase [Verrucomicrobiae bacterium]
MTSSDIRQSFLDFFKSKQHTIVPSSSLMPDSPNLLFTNAGMNQFVPIFLGQIQCPYNPPRAADTQKCIRAGGKHNDLDDVGLDTYHHTFFEMLGNWSFGNYFKQEAIDWAWELITEVWKFPKNRLYATVYSPDKTKGDPSDFDQEAYDFWAAKFTTAGLDPKVHIVYGNKKDNFWMMGETGPCGPCSELHVDLTPDGSTKGSLVNKGSAQCIEIWNLVFIQFNANPDGTFSPLPARHVDTGMGFERVTSIIQCTKNFTNFSGIISNYETDIFRPIFDVLEKMSGKRYTSTLPGQNIPGEHTRPRVSPTAPSRSASESGHQPGTKYSRRNLPHFERPWAKYMVTFSTHDHRKLTAAERDLTLRSILYAHEHRQYQLYAACVMPDHVHLLFEPQIKEKNEAGETVFWSLREILQGIKSASAHQINESSATKGHVWEQEYMDRMIRGDSDFEEKFHYICRNPWDSGDASATENYPWLWTPGVSAEQVNTAENVNAVVPTAGAQSAAREGACAPREQEQLDIAFRVIADHIRTLSFSIADGIQPGNTDRNYVLRRILRRAVRYGRTLGFHQPFFYKLVDVLADTMGGVFPEIRARQQIVKDVLKTEEEAFNKTLDRGIELFEKASSSNSASQSELPANFAFTLYDTYGFPYDLTELMARERGLTVDKAGFDKLMEEQKARARAAQKKEVISLSQIETTAPTKFVGFEQLQTPAKVLEVVSVKDKTGVILDVSSAYAEMGGQVGDTGEMSGAGQLWRVANTQKTGNTFLHFLADKDAPAIGTTVELSVDAPRRGAIQRHHTVTHLLHWALHEVVNQEATQKGSFVGPDKLTFDFNSAALTPAQVRDIEKLVNERIVENAGVSWTEVPHDDVKQRKDVMQFFGEKYGDVVRVVQIGGQAGALNGYSMELCGGTHTRATGEIGLFRIVSEAAVAAGVRRIEAVAGLAAYQAAHQEAELLRSVAGRVSAPIAELEKKIDSLLTHQREIEKQLKSFQQKEAAQAARGLVARAQNIGADNLRAIIENLGNVDGDYLQAVADALKGEFKGVVVLGGTSNGAVSLIATVSPEFTAKVQAGKIIQTIAPIVGGKGGGKPDNARGGGKDIAKLDEALAKAKALLSV